MTDTHLSRAYAAGAEQALEDFQKKANPLLSLAKAAPEFTSGANRALAYGSAPHIVGGGLMGALAGGEDNRLLGALAGAGLGYGAGRLWGSRAGVAAQRAQTGAAEASLPRQLELFAPSAEAAGGAVEQSALLGSGLANLGLAGGAGIVGGGAMNALGLTDRPEGWFERTFG